MDTDHDVRSPSTGHSRPGTPGRLEVPSARQLPVALPYRSGTLPRNLQARLKSGADTLKRQEVNYRTADDDGHEDEDSYSDSDSASGTGGSPAFYFSAVLLCYSSFSLLFQTTPPPPVLNPLPQRRLLPLLK